MLFSHHRKPRSFAKNYKLKQSYSNIIFTIGISIMILLSSKSVAAEFSRKDTVFFPSNDNIIQQKDTTRIIGLPKEYRIIKEQSSRNRWTRKLFSLLFREARRTEDIEDTKNIVEIFKPYEGRIIRNINIVVLSPFGTDVNHPEQESNEFNFLNNAHVLTQDVTIRNIIQFREGKPLNAAIAATSEAELRSAGYIYDARIGVRPIAHTEDSIDVNIVVRDKWTIGMNIHSLSAGKTDVEVFDKNILGTGSRIGLDFIYSNRYDRKFGFGGNYTYENVARRNINLTGSYTDQIREYELSLAAIRPLQPKLNYFGEAGYSRNVLRPDRIDWDSITPELNENYSLTIGRAFTLSEDKAIKRLALSLRYKSKSPQYKDPDYKNHIKDLLVPYKYTENRMLLMQLSLYQNSYLREYMIYNFGNTEDIAQGYNLSMQLGYSDFSDIRSAMYASLSAAYGSSEIVNGNIYVSSAISSFLGNGKPFGGVFKVDARYFTRLFRFTRMRWRQFVSINYSKLLHPDRYIGDRIYMGQHTNLEMRDWRNDRKGTELLLLKSETDVFSNYEIAGFRFLFYTFFDMGWIKQSKKLFESDNFNYGVGLGIRLRNNFIVFNTIDLKIGLYPRLEQNGFNSFFKVNSSTPDMYPNFTPNIPKEILLEY